MPTSDRIILGKLGEDFACRELERRGYAIVARGYRTRVGELDIVAHDGDTLVFVEVKTRRSADYGLPREAVSAWKQRKVWLMALDFLMRTGWHNRPCRFDVVEVQMLGSDDALVEVISDAFEACE